MKRKILIVILAALTSLFIWRVEHFFEELYHEHARYTLIISGALMAVTLILTRLYQTPVKGAGIFWLKSHLEHGLYPISFKKLFQYLFSLVTSLSALAPLGREAPSITLGGAWGSVLSPINISLNEKENNIRMGIVAAFSAAFKAPLSGMLFVFEALDHRKNKKPFLAPTIWMASLFGFLCAGVAMGWKSILTFPEVDLLDWKMLLLSLVFAIGVGLISSFVFQFFFKLKKWIFHLSHDEGHTVRLILLHLIALTFFYITMIFSPEAVGSGFDLVKELIHGDLHHFNLLLLIFFVRVGLLVWFYALVFPGGTFVPFLALGSLAGAMFAVGLSHLIILSKAQMIWFVILGVATFFASMMHAPFTISILLVELSYDFKLLPFLLVFSYLAFYLKKRLHQTEFYHF